MSTVYNLLSHRTLWVVERLAKRLEDPRLERLQLVSTDRNSERSQELQALHPHSLISLAMKERKDYYRRADLAHPKGRKK